MMKKLIFGIVLVGALAAFGLSAAYERPASTATETRVDPPDNFLWVFGKLYKDQAHYENLLAFAERHDLSMIMAPASVSLPDEELAAVEVALRQARDRGIPVMFNTGVFREEDDWPIGPVIVDDPEWRAKYTEALQRTARTYLEHYPGGRVIVGHEDPLFSNWPHRHEDNYREYGGEMFKIQRAAVKEVDPSAQVGIFILPSYVLEMYEAFMPQLKAEGLLPDFNMLDKYRGYQDPRLGLAGTNAETRRLLREVKEMTDDRPIYYLGQDHTINTGYTPSREAIEQHADAALAEGVDGIGWYIRTVYRPTRDVSTLDGTVEPFLPNTGEVDTELYTTFTGDRDRFMYAYLTTFESQGLIDRAERFDLWVHGADLDLHEARVSLRTVNGDWRYIGDIGGYVGGDNPYTLDDREGAVIFHALDRDTFLRSSAAGAAGVGLEARIEPRDGSDGLVIHGLYAMPYATTAGYVTEQEASEQLVMDPERVARWSLGHVVQVPAVTLRPGDSWTSGAGSE